MYIVLGGVVYIVGTRGQLACHQVELEVTLLLIIFILACQSCWQCEGGAWCGENTRL